MKDFDGNILAVGDIVGFMLQKGIYAHDCSLTKGVIIAISEKEVVVQYIDNYFVIYKSDRLIFIE